MRITKIKIIVAIVIISVLTIGCVQVPEQEEIKTDDVFSTAQNLHNGCNEAFLAVTPLFENPTSENLTALIPVANNAKTVCNRELIYLKEHRAALDQNNWATDTILKLETNQKLLDRIIDFAYTALAKG